jgi:uncharacterized protein YndB with AHSA1/START domain
VPQHKDLKRLVRSRMQKTGESYTAARLQLVRKVEPPPDYAGIAGMSDDAVVKATGRTWIEWVRTLDAARATEKAHLEIARYVASLGTPSWWAQMVTVGYERIRGLRATGQRRDGAYEASKSRTFPVPVEQLFDAFADAKLRRKWLGVSITVRSATRPKRMRITWEDGTQVQVGFFAKGEQKSSVAIQHEKLADKQTAEAMKKAWGEKFDRLAELFA